ncbi:MAG: tryptophan 7-halogenase, partial [Gammaproteobacteria bacterium]|nr:tryptophan 7-halogenase [Gammaproteobacteria bacterium]
MSDNAIKKIIIVGGGSAGWMTAAMLSQQLQGNCDITLIESEQIGTVGVGEATIPPIKVFNNLLGIKENDFLKSCNGSIKLGIQFENWLSEQHAYFHQFGRFGTDFDYIPFPYFWLESAKHGNPHPLQEYSSAWHMAKNNKFIPPAQDKRSLFSGMDYAYHFDAGLYANFLKSLSLQKGVSTLDGVIEKVELNPETGFIDAVVLNSGKKHSADLFIDCSGMRSLLLGQSLGVDFVDWSEHLLCDSAYAVQTSHVESIKPYTRSIAHKAGWQWRIPLQTRMGNGNVFASQFMSNDEAKELLTSSVDGELLTEPRLIKFKPGRREKFWHKNCVAVGLSAGFLEPLESTSLHLIQRAIMRLISYFPDKTCNETNVAHYNQITTDEYEHIRDFIILH